VCNLHVAYFFYVLLHRPLHRSIRDHHRCEPIENLMPRPPECVEDSIVKGARERFLSVGREGICCDAFLSLRAQIAP
jgi:hypothetical protein